MQQDGDPRSDLPDASGPPVEGPRWAWVKIFAWGGAVVVLLCVAAVTTWLVSRVQTALADGPREVASERPVVEAPPVVSTPSQPPAPVTVPAPVEPVGTQQGASKPPETSAPETQPRRPLLMQR